jgi:small conductance mechanosensitive channel
MNAFIRRGFLRQFDRIWIRAGLGVAVAMFLLAATVSAQTETSAPEAEPEPEALSEEVAAQLDEALAALADLREDIATLERRTGVLRPGARLVLKNRLDRVWISLLEAGVSFGRQVVAAKSAGYDISGYQPAVETLLDAQVEIVEKTYGRLTERFILPTMDQSIAEQAIGYERMFTSLQAVDEIFEIWLEGLVLAEQLGYDISDQEDLLRVTLENRGMNGAVFLQISLDNVTGLEAAVKASPEDAGLKAQLAIAQVRVQQTASVLAAIVEQMEVLGVETAYIREMLLTATGAITTDIFNVKVVVNLLSRWGSAMVDMIAADGPTLVFRLLIFAFIIYISRKVAGVVDKLIERGLRSSKVHLSRLLKNMITSMASNLVFALGVLIGLSTLGISLGPLLAGLGIAGFVIGFALQDSLSNFASGMMILIYRPFDVGDVVEGGGVLGKVNDMSLVNTTILTFDNQTVIVPNNMIWSGVIKNITAQKIRRVDLVFGVSYSDDIDKTEKVLTEIVEAHEQVLDEPEPLIKLHELADSSVNFVVRPWVKSEDYWDVYWDLMSTVKRRFDEEGISIPFPQRDVHMISQEEK